MRTIFATFNIAFAEARHNLVARLIDTHRLKAAASQSAQAITAYLHYACENGADPARAIGDRTELSRVLGNGGLMTESQSAQQAAHMIGAR
jgi:hypothetical protein